MLERILLIIPALLCLGCASTPALYSEHHRIPVIAFEGHYPGNWSGVDTRPQLYVIPETPGSPYRSARNLVIRIHPSQLGIAGLLLLEELYPGIKLPDSFYEQERVYYITSIDDAGVYDGWVGPVTPDDARMQAILSRGIDFAQAFDGEHLASDMVAFVRDMRYCLGETYPVYGDSPYVIHWPSLSEALQRRADPGLEGRSPSGDVWLSERGYGVWVPVMVANGASLGGYDGGLSAGLDFADGRVNSLFIDLN